VKCYSGISERLRIVSYPSVYPGESYAHARCATSGEVKKYQQYFVYSSLALHGYSDSDFAGCRLDRKSTSKTCQFLGSSLAYWSSRKQSSVAQSNTDAEYVATASCCSQLLCITYTMSNFGKEHTHVPLQCENTSAIILAKNLVLHSKTKHIELRYDFLRDNVEKRKIALIHVHTHD
jgi:hypothetical protein